MTSGSHFRRQVILSSSFEPLQAPVIVFATVVGVVFAAAAAAAANIVCL